MPIGGGAVCAGCRTAVVPAATPPMPPVSSTIIGANLRTTFRENNSDLS